jgi:copper(I)-binding protein
VEDLRASPVAAAENHIYLSGTVGSTPGATLVGADTPFGRADLTATSGCIGGGPEPMSQWRIDPHGSISLVLGGGYLAVWKASGLPDEGSAMPVTLRFSDAADVTVSAVVQPVEREDTPAAVGDGCSG